MRQKGFTLIELLVVVAIIGILAAVGVVAYNGYTTAAKKSVAKTNQKNVVRWLAAEAQKCQMGAEKVLNDQVTCSSISSKINSSRPSRGSWSPSWAARSPGDETGLVWGGPHALKDCKKLQIGAFWNNSRVFGV